MHVLVSVEMVGEIPGAFIFVICASHSRSTLSSGRLRAAMRKSKLSGPPSSCRPCSGARNAGSRSRRWPITQIQMHADAKFRMIAAHGESRFKARPFASREVLVTSPRRGHPRFRGLIPSVQPRSRIHYQFSTYAHPCPFGQLLFVCTAIFVPLTVFLSNSSMASRGKMTVQTPGTQRSRSALRRKTPRTPHDSRVPIRLEWEGADANIMLVSQT